MASSRPGTPSGRSAPAWASTAPPSTRSFERGDKIMPAAGVVTLLAVFITVGALAFYLVRIALVLKHVNFTLGTVVAGGGANEVGARPPTPPPAAPARG